VFGGIGWVFGLTGLGFLVGDLPFVKKYFDKVILAIILVSVLPVLIEAWKARSAKPAAN
jgi:membrane-associated protein